LGIGDWGLGIGPNLQSPIPNPHPQNLFKNKFLFNFKLNDKSYFNLFENQINISNIKK